jgi:effector-binding domain-containing protein/carbon monoxide dehydrogenase subunit G
MKWFLGLILIVALICAALFGVGYFLLPNSLAVSRSITIARPRATVFAMVNDLHIVKEWSPYYALDPDADYEFSGEDAGAGQSMRWNSKVRQVGAGRMSIVNSVENEEVDTILEFTGRAELNTVMQLQPVEHGAQVTWTVTAECRTGPINVPCRYMNLVMRGMVERDLDSGLARLKTLTEQLPDVDFEGLQPEFVVVEPQNYIFSPITTSNQNQADVDRALHLGLTQVDDFMNQFQLTKAGPQVRVTTNWDQSQGQMSFRVGYPFSGPTPLTVVGVQIGQTPSGRALRVLHEGPRETMRDTYAKIYAFLQAHRINVRQDGLPWEVVLNEDTPNNTQIEIFVPLE